MFVYWVWVIHNRTWILKQLNVHKFTLPVESELNTGFDNDINFKEHKCDQKLYLKQRSFYNKINYVSFIHNAQ